MKITSLSIVNKGFALPTVMIASVVMLIVLVSGLSATTTINAALRAQFDNKLLEQSLDAGTNFAVRCIASNGGTAPWFGLYPISACNNASATNVCPDAGTPANCFVVNTPDYKTTFTVGPASVDANGVDTVVITGRLIKIRASNSTTFGSTATRVLSVGDATMPALKDGIAF
ncbi:hypothetical protein H7142_02745 [Candidatus Saccharibacteria bacterium]|nr:hypothetical protein [Candidatus Saccharibacteria bacterium]